MKLHEIIALPTSQTWFNVRNKQSPIEILALFTLANFSISHMGGKPGLTDALKNQLNQDFEIFKKCISKISKNEILEDNEIKALQRIAVSYWDNDEDKTEGKFKAQVNDLSRQSKEDIETFKQTQLKKASAMSSKNTLFEWNMDSIKMMLEQNVCSRAFIQNFINNHGKQKVLSSLGESLKLAGFSNSDFNEPLNESELNQLSED